MKHTCIMLSAMIVALELEDPWFLSSLTHEADGRQIRPTFGSDQGPVG